MNTTATAKQTNTTTQTNAITNEQKELLWRTMPAGITKDEFDLFLYQCAHTGLNPFTRQIYCIARKQKNSDGTWGQKLTTQASIDGLRVIAENTKCYAPGEATEYREYNGKLYSAVASVRKRVGKEWFVVKAEAFLQEYVQCGRDGLPMGLWAKMPRLMLAKCAEALALRKAFPQVLSGIYSTDEMMQADMAEAENITPEYNKSRGKPTETVLPSPEQVISIDHPVPANEYAQTTENAPTEPYNGWASENMNNTLRFHLANAGVPDNRMEFTCQCLVAGHRGVENAISFVCNQLNKGYLWDAATGEFAMAHHVKKSK